MGLTDDGGLVLQLSVHDDGQVNDLRAWVDGAGWLPLRAIVRGATWQQPHPITTPTTVVAVFGHGCHQTRYTGRVQALVPRRWGPGWVTLARFDWTPGAAVGRLVPTRPAPAIRRPKTQAVDPAVVMRGDRRAPRPANLLTRLGRFLDRRLG